MSETTLYPWLVGGLFAAAFLTIFALSFVTAPYGRHARGGWGPSISTRAGWLVREVPSVVVFGGVYALGRFALEPAPLALLALWCTHYVYRGLVYPFPRGRVADGPPVRRRRGLVPGGVGPGGCTGG